MIHRITKYKIRESSLGGVKIDLIASTLPECQ